MGFKPGIFHPLLVISHTKDDRPFSSVGAFTEIKERVRERDCSESEGHPIKRARADTSILLPPGTDEQNVEDPPRPAFAVMFSRSLVSTRLRIPRQSLQPS